MKFAKLFIAIYLIILPAFLNAAVRGTITNIRAPQGNLYIAVFKSIEDFNNKTGYKGIIKKANSTQVIFTFDHLPPGWYMIAVYHDLNSNEKLDTNFLNIPKEPYGFSLNRMGLFGPSWEKSKFYYEGKDIDLEIQLTQ